MVATSTVFRLARTASVSSWMKVEGAGGQPLDAVDLARVGHQLVDEEKAGAAGVEQLAQGVGAGRNPAAVGGAYPVVEGRVPGLLRELGGDLPLQGADGDAEQVRGAALPGKVDGGAHHHRDPRGRRLPDARLRAALELRDAAATSSTDVDGPSVP